MNLALFDFDGTISRKDTLIEFVKFTQYKISIIKGAMQLLPEILLNKLKLLDSHLLKEHFLGYFFYGINENEFRETAKDFSLNILPKIIKQEALDKIKWHKSKSDKIVVVSASLECLLKSWCEINNIELIANKLEFIEGRFTGKLATKNCKGQEKVNRIRQGFNLQEFDYIYAYGDSEGDKEMLAIANEQYYKLFANKVYLKKNEERRNWKKLY